MWRACLPFLLLGLGCTGKADDSADGDGDADTDTDTDPDTDTDTDTDTDADAPTILSADAYCYLHSVGDKYYQWIASAQADDPQGVDTLAALGDVGVSAGGTPVYDGVLACSRESGLCTASFKADESGVGCDNAAGFTFAFVVYDEDGNASAPFEVAGRQE